MKKIGVVAAIEMGAVRKKYGNPTKTVNAHGFAVDIYETEEMTLYAADSGAGEIAAAAAVQELISGFGVEMVLNFGVVGALTEEMATAELCVVDSVIHYDLDTTGWVNLPRGQYPGKDSPWRSTDRALLQKALAVNPGLKVVRCASADKFVSRAEEKAALRQTYGADICEMEAAGIVYTCERCAVPCLLLKAVSDSLTGGGREFFAELERVSDICFAMLDEIVRTL